MSGSLALVLVLAFLLLINNVPIWAALVFACIPYFIINQVPLSIIPTQMSTGTISSFILLAFPLFTLAGRLMNTGGVTKRIFDFADTVVGWIPGGLGHVNVFASMIFAGMSGSAVADIGGLGLIEIKGMKEKGYDLDFSAAITIASSTIGPIIPPSAPMVLFAVMANESVGRLFLGGVLPGVVMGVSLMVMVYFYSRSRNYPVSVRPNVAGFFKALRLVCLPMLNPLIILSGMVGGVFTPTEAAAVAVAYAFLLGKFVYRELTWGQAFGDVKETVKFCGSVYAIVGAALIFSTVLTRERVGDALIEFVKSYSLGPTALVFALSAVVFIMGCFVEVTAMFFLLVPVFIPLIEAMGISKVFFGVVFTIVAVYGILTPPFGLGLFMISSMTGLSFNRVVKATMPFLIPLIISVILLILFPKIVTFLPDLLMG
jgi:tripartite ATP-independent transporter DctM subunit